MASRRVASSCVVSAVDDVRLSAIKLISGRIGLTGPVVKPSLYSRAGLGRSAAKKKSKIAPCLIWANNFPVEPTLMEISLRSPSCVVGGYGVLKLRGEVTGHSNA